MSIKENIYPVRNVYKNIKGKGKVKILTKDKPYTATIEYWSGLKFHYIIDDLGNTFSITRKDMFYTRVAKRDKIINELLS